MIVLSIHHQHMLNPFNVTSSCVAGAFDDDDEEQTFRARARISLYAFHYLFLHCFARLEKCSAQYLARRVVVVITILRFVETI